MSGENLIVGVDGGGTKTIAWLADAGEVAAGRPLGMGVAGPANLRTLSPQKALENIDTAIEQAFTDAKIARCELDAACFALAGTDRQAESQLVQQWAERRNVARRVSITNDADAVLAAGDCMTSGIALISGTGAFAFGRYGDETSRSGGWGPLLGDEGSGYWIAVAGLQQATRAADGRDADRSLLKRFLKVLDLPQPSELIPKLYAPDFGRPEIAALAHVVFSAAGEGSEPAQRIVEQAGRELAAQVRAVANQLAFRFDTFPLVMAGGNLVHQPELAEIVLTHLATDALVADPVVKVQSPVAGAVKLAARLIYQERKTK